ncbi:myelin-oligodendrocyte glycoprotein-like [Corvus hawaiiensis]|uniref:myelin-oligodendrocyte glycoprotein-like n=1 Tax=Corvus kubaryi TaxID=68294 RepID=UPI001C03E8E7|nr:myelin-oligodendrocyte glycoprotein-like [Corvus kubaryi]XP_041890139.1 myelin-oligodendrocyte glycoprotein-like [Corvus kubaryi]XP_048145915.1 myelin-oligodendrocyte glycoprotein-like [Corvus hawaiiensis]XP_048145920.1 myelin-oligodendrocyte glycoprotein-like [Corvus hawaiiensis]
MKWETALWMIACLLLASLPRGQLDTTCHAFVGETVVLPCTTTPPGDLTLAKSMLYWQIGTKIVHFFQKGQDSLKAQDEHFHGRTSLFLDQMKHGNLSLKISNVQLEDNAEYTCIYRQTGGHETKKSKIRLNVSAPAPSRIEDPPSPSGQSQICSGSPMDVPRLAMLPFSFLLLVPLGVWHL